MALRYPLDNIRMTQGWGADPTFYAQYGQKGHNGIDLGAPVGKPVYAVDDGTVVYEGWGGGHSWVGKEAGIHVLIKHAALVSNYAHLSATVVNAGQKVKKGQLIGYVGVTGVANGAHLHFEVFPLKPNFSNGYAGRINPMPYLTATKNATVEQIKKAYLEILERPADADGLKHYQAYTIEFVRADLLKSAEKKRLDAKKAEAAKAAAEKAQQEAAQRVAEATKAAEAKKALEAARKAEEEREAAETELARVAEEERIAKEAAEARAKAQAEVAQKAKEVAMATIAEEQQKAEELADTVAESDVVKDLVAGVSKRTKFVVYVIGDTLIGLGIIAPGVAVVAGWEDLVRVAALSGLLAAAGGFILTMFGIYKSGSK